MDIDPDKWFYDKLTPDLIQVHRIEEVLYSGQTRFQSVQIVRTGGFGLCLVLDRKIQSSEVDEFIYHEALVHPAMLAHPAPETVFIAGGGEGATLREVLSHKSVRRVVMIDIDAEVVEICKKFLPRFSSGAFEDERSEVIHTDARKYLADNNIKFDVIIIDIPDPIEEGPAYLLYTQEFYRLVWDRLNPGGVICVQSGPTSLIELLNFSAIYRTLKSVFPVVSPYHTYVPAFGGTWGFCIASENLNPALLSPDEINARVSTRGLPHLKLYDGLTHQGMFSLPGYLRRELERRTRLITDNNPLYTYQD